jgi:divalent metal cation (Fe/Co/Zn/Cd) transporter
MLQKPISTLFHFGYARMKSFAAFVTAVIIVVLGAFIVYQAYESMLHRIAVTNPEIMMVTLAAAGSILLHRTFRVRSVAKKHKLDAKNSIKDGTASFVGLGALSRPTFLRSHTWMPSATS